MASLLAARSFVPGTFASVGPDLFECYTCLGCGTRSATWHAFRAHRGACRDRLWAIGAAYERFLFRHCSALIDRELGPLRTSAQPALHAAVFQPAHAAPSPEGRRATSAATPPAEAGGVPTSLPAGQAWPGRGRGRPAPVAAWGTPERWRRAPQGGAPETRPRRPRPIAA
jgi:hypothetical protein